MSIWNTIKGWFKKAEKEVEVTPIKEEAKPVVVKSDVELATQAIETRLAEKSEEKKVTAKEIKAKVKPSTEKKAEAKPATEKKPKAKKDRS